MIKTTHTVLGVALAASFLLAGCGPESTKASSSSETSKPDEQGPGGNSEQFEEIQACLKKAGLEDKLPQRREKSERPSQGADGKAGPFADEEVQAALKACGIDVPERPNGPGQQADQG